MIPEPRCGACRNAFADLLARAESSANAVLPAPCPSCAMDDAAWAHWLERAAVHGQVLRAIPDRGRARSFDDFLSRLTEASPAGAVLRSMRPVPMPATRSAELLERVFAQAAEAGERELGALLREGIRPAVAPPELEFDGIDPEVPLSPASARGLDALATERAPGWLWVRIRSLHERRVARRRHLRRVAAAGGLLAAAVLVTMLYLGRPPATSDERFETRVVFIDSSGPFAPSLPAIAREVRDAR